VRLCPAPACSLVAGQAPGCGHPFGVPAVAGRGGMGRSACGQRDQSGARPRRPGAGARPGADHALPVSGPAHPACCAWLRAASDLTCPSRIAYKTQVSSLRAAAALAMSRARAPRRAMMRSLSSRGGLSSGWCRIASAMAHRRFGGPCLVMCPRATFRSDSRCRGVSPAQLHRWQTPPAVVAEIDLLLNHHTCAQIAGILNDRGLASGERRPFRPVTVQRIIRDYHLRPRRDRLRDAGLLTLTEMAAALGVAKITVKAWHHASLVSGQRYNDKGEVLYDPPGPNPPAPHYGRPRLADRRPAQTT
jgi:hypothetical protein